MCVWKDTSWPGTETLLEWLQLYLFICIVGVVFYPYFISLLLSCFFTLSVLILFYFVWFGFDLFIYLFISFWYFICLLPSIRFDSSFKWTSTSSLVAILKWKYSRKVPDTRCIHACVFVWPIRTLGGAEGDGRKWDIKKQHGSNSWSNSEDFIQCTKKTSEECLFKFK